MHGVTPARHGAERGSDKSAPFLGARGWVRELLYPQASSKRSLRMETFSWAHALERSRAALRTRLTLRGPRAYADTHDVALGLLCAGQRHRGRGLSALDLGAGRGELSARLAALGYDVTAVERYVPQFEAKVPLIDADLNHTFPFEDATFDVPMASVIL